MSADPLPAIPMTTGASAPVRTRRDLATAYVEVIADLYRRYLETTPPDARYYRYIHAHARNRAALSRHVEAFLTYAPALDGAGRVLDWGCRQAVDACLVRLHLGPAVELHGCDIDAGDFAPFHDFAGLRHRPLTHTWVLPYPDDMFDVVIGSGALEHAANDGQSLTELWRVLRPGGRLAVTFLPNAWSWSEAANRALGNPHHLRRYRLGEMRRRLLHHGFLPERWGYHQVLPTAAGGSRLADQAAVRLVLERAFTLNRTLERLWPIDRFAANIWFVARKVPSF